MARILPVWLLAATTALAQSPAPAGDKAATPPPEDAIAAAKRDFNSIKNSRNALEQPKVELPSMAAPDLQTAPAMPRPLTSPKLDPKAAKKSTNWLVDAMMKSDSKDSRDPREPAADSLLNDPDTALDFKDSKSSLDSRRTASKGDDTKIAEKRVGAEVNPLTRYMAGWMTPQDYTLLKPGMDGAAAANLPSRGDPSLSAVGVDSSTLGDRGSALDLSLGVKAESFTSPKSADNPFLQALSPSVASAPAVPTLPAPPASTSAQSIFAPVPPPAPVAPAKSKIPDFAKPAMDEKYFKQLKRF